MIMSDKCFLRDSCKKYNAGKCSLNETTFCPKLFKIDYLYSESLLSDSQRVYKVLHPDSNGTDMELFKALSEMTKNIEDFVDSGKNLFLFSKTCGNGKTEWAVRFLQEYINAVWYKCDLKCQCLFINVPKFLLEMKNNISHESEYYNQIKNNVEDAKIVVWDDIATKTATEYEHEALLSLIDSRMNRTKSNIFTTNIHPNNLSSYLGDRLASRILGFSYCGEFKGIDKRGLKFIS